MQTMLYIFVGIIVLGVIAEIPLLQAIPFIVVAFLMYQWLFCEKNTRTVIIVISVVMAVLNLVSDDPSLLDVGVWSTLAIIAGSSI